MDRLGRRIYDQNGKYIQPMYRKPARQARAAQRAPLQRQNAFYGTPNVSTSMARTVGIAAPLYPKPELKFFDVHENLVAIAGWNGMIGSGAGVVNQIPQDVTPSGRVGRTVIMKSFQLRWQIDVSAAAPTINRILCVCTKSATVSGIAQILTVTTTADGLLNLNNSDQFEVLWDKYPQRDQQVQTPRADAYYKKLNHELQFNIPSGIINQGQLYVFFFCTAGTINCTTRVRYIDM